MPSSLEEFGVALGAGGEHDDVWRRPMRSRVEADEGEHLAADGFVADPEDEVLAELAVSTTWGRVWRKVRMRSTSMGLGYCSSGDRGEISR